MAVDQASARCTALGRVNHAHCGAHLRVWCGPCGRRVSRERRDWVVVITVNGRAPERHVCGLRGGGVCDGIEGFSILGNIPAGFIQIVGICDGCTVR